MRLTTPDLLESWQLGLHDKRPRTVKLYLEEMNRFAGWLADHDRPAGNPGDLLAVTRDDARAWVAAMQAQGLAGNTVRNRWVAARSMYGWLVDEEELDESPFAKVHVSKPNEPPPDMLTEDDLRALLRACSGSTFLDKRDHALIRFMLATGLRLSEVVGVRIDDLDLPGRVVVLEGKGGKHRRVRFDPATAAALDKYRRARARHKQAGLRWFWVSHQGRLTAKGLPSVLTKRARMAEIAGGVHAHSLRHTWAHRLKSKGMSDENVRELGGWESAEVMRRYGGALAADRALAAYDDARPMDGL